MKKIAVIGAGNMGSVIIKRLKGKYKIFASDIDKKRLKGLKIKTAKDNKTLVKGADIIILAIKPQSMDSVLNEITGLVKSNQLIISIAAGIKTKRIEDKIGRIPVVRAMPNTPLLVGMGMTGLCSGRYAKSGHIRIAEKIFSDMGKVISVKEKLMDAVTAISGSGPAYIYLFIESLIKSGIKLGLAKKMSEKLVFQTFKGAISLLETTGKTPEALRKQVTSPGGTTEAALRVFEKKLFSELVHTAIHSAHKRSKELSK